MPGDTGIPSTVGPSEKFAIVTNNDGTISLRSVANNLYVTAEQAGEQPLIANRAAIGPWESFVRTYHHMVALDAWGGSGGGLVAAENWGTGPLAANRPQIGPWEQFDRIDLGGNQVAFRAAVNGLFVRVHSPFVDQRLIASSYDIGTAETFILERNTDSSYSLRSLVTNRYVTTVGSIPALAADAAAISGNWEKFTLFTTSA